MYGFSRAGKDEFSKILKKYYLFKHIHPLSDVYTFLEEHYGLPKDSIMYDSGKQFIPPGSTKTVSHLLVEFFFFVKEKEVGDWSLPFLEKALSGSIKKNQNIVLSGIRNQHEVCLIFDLLKKNPNYELIPISVVRKNHNGYKSDYLQAELYKELVSFANKTFTIQNDSTLESYKNNIHLLIQNHILL